MNEQLEHYKYLWEKKIDGWVLLRSQYLAGGFVVFNKLNNTLLIIDCENTNEIICKYMIENGCEIIDNIPKSIPNVSVQQGWDEAE